MNQPILDIVDQPYEVELGSFLAEVDVMPEEESDFTVSFGETVLSFFEQDTNQALLPTPGKGKGKAQGVFWLRINEVKRRRKTVFWLRANEVKRGRKTICAIKR